MQAIWSHWKQAADGHRDRCLQQFVAISMEAKQENLTHTFHCLLACEKGEREREERHRLQAEMKSCIVPAYVQIYFPCKNGLAFCRLGRDLDVATERKIERGKKLLKRERKKCQQSGRLSVREREKEGESVVE